MELLEILLLVLSIKQEQYNQWRVCDKFEIFLFKDSLHLQLFNLILFIPSQNDSTVASFNFDMIISTGNCAFKFHVKLILCFLFRVWITWEASNWFRRSGNYIEEQLLWSEKISKRGCFSLWSESKWWKKHRQNA